MHSRRGTARNTSKNFLEKSLCLQDQGPLVIIRFIRYRSLRNYSFLPRTSRKASSFSHPPLCEWTGGAYDLYVTRMWFSKPNRLEWQDLNKNVQVNEWHRFSLPAIFRCERVVHVFRHPGPPFVARGTIAKYATVQLNFFLFFWHCQISLFEIIERHTMKSSFASAFLAMQTSKDHFHSRKDLSDFLESFRFDAETVSPA